MSKKKDRNRESKYTGSYDDFHRPDIVNHYGKGPKGYRRSDEKIYDEVCERLTAHYDVDASDISVQVSDGIVNLDGSVDSRRTKRLSEDIVSEVNGVIDVRNRLSIQSLERLDETRPTAPRLRSPADSTDSDLRRRH